MKDFKAKYEVDDGYCGGSRPQTFTIPADWLPAEATDEELLEFFYVSIDEDMRNRISYHKVNETEFLEWAHSAKTAR